MFASIILPKWQSSDMNMIFSADGAIKMTADVAGGFISCGLSVDDVSFYNLLNEM